MRCPQGEGEGMKEGGERQWGGQKELKWHMEEEKKRFTFGLSSLISHVDQNPFEILETSDRSGVWAITVCVSVYLCVS